MKQLIKAQEVYNKIIDIDKKISKIEDLIELILEEKSDLKIKVGLLDKKEELKLDEDGSLMLNNSVINPVLLWSGTGKSKETNNDFKSKINDTEGLIMFSSLLNYKKEVKKQLVKEFENLHKVK